MDGKLLQYQLNKILNEGETSSFIDTRTSYDYLYQAACELSRLLQTLTGTQTITTVAGQTTYDINADYYCQYIHDTESKFFVTFDNGSDDDSNMYFRDAAALLGDGITDTRTVLNTYTIMTADLPDRVTGTATESSEAEHGQATLTDSAADFSDIEAGDLVYNVDDESSGVVLAKVSDTALTTALFGGSLRDGDVKNGWWDSDEYYIHPQSRKQMVLGEIPYAAGYEITLNYIKKPAPVYSDIGRYNFDQTFTAALTKYASFLYKFRDAEPNFASNFLAMWEREVRLARAHEDRTLNRKGYRVNFKKRSSGDRSYR